MADSLGKLSVILSIDGQTFTAELDKAAGEVGKFKQQLDQGAGGIGGLASAAVGGAAGAVAGLVTQQLQGFAGRVEGAAESVAQLARESDRLGVSTETLKGLQLAAGPAAEGMSRILDHLSRELGAVREGSEEAAAKFRLLGLDGKALSGLPIDRALGAISDRFRTLPTAADRARLGFQLFGRNWAELAPLLAKGSEGFAAAQRRAEELGVTLSREAAGKVLDAKGALRELQAVTEAVGQSLAVVLAPAVKDAATGLSDMAAGAGGAKNAVADMAQGAEGPLVGLVALAENLGHSLNVSGRQFMNFASLFQGGPVVQGWLKDFLGGQQAESGGFAERLKKDLDEGIAALRKATPGGAAGPGGPDMAGRVGELTHKLQEQADAFGLSGSKAEIYKLKRDGATEADLRGLRAIDRELTLLGDITTGAAVGANAFEQFADRVEDLATALDKGAISGAAFQNTYAKLLDDLRKADAAKAAKLWEESLGPLGQFNSELADLSRLAAQGTVGFRLEAQGAYAAFESLEKSLGSMEIKAPGALTKDSAQATSVILENARRQSDNPQQRVERVLEQAKEIQQKHLDTSRQIFDELRRRGLVKGAAINF